MKTTTTPTPNNIKQQQCAAASCRRPPIGIIIKTPTIPRFPKATIEKIKSFSFDRTTNKLQKFQTMTSAQRDVDAVNEYDSNLSVSPLQCYNI
jgi:hypothetical protein